MLRGSDSPEVLKPDPVTLAAAMVTFAVPGFCSVIVWEVLDPIATLGKLALMGTATSCACPCGWGCGVGGTAPPVPLLGEVLEPITTPAQPLLNVHVPSAIINKNCEGQRSPDLWSAIVRQV